MAKNTKNESELQTGITNSASGSINAFTITKNGVLRSIKEPIKIKRKPKRPK